MKELVITEMEAGQRMDKLLKKYLNNAPSSFIYKMLRKKNIILNGKKADGTEILLKNDCINLFLADDTIEKFHTAIKLQNINERKHIKRIDVIYEDNNILLLNKPSGILTQKSNEQDISLNEQMIAYLLENKSLTKEALATFRPSVCNRLDRNTSGLVICGKNLAALQKMSELLKLRTMRKYYLCVVIGEITKPEYLKGYLIKNEKANEVKIFPEAGKEHPDKSLLIETKYEPVYTYGVGETKRTLLRVELLTGKSHQIRAHLASIGHPIIGDYKYGRKKTNEFYKKHYQVNSQLLHAYQLQMPEMEEEWSYLSGKSFTAEPPSIFEDIKK